MTKVTVLFYGTEHGGRKQTPVGRYTPTGIIFSYEEHHGMVLEIGERPKFGEACEASFRFLMPSKKLLEKAQEAGSIRIMEGNKQVGEIVL